MYFSSNAVAALILLPLATTQGLGSLPECAQPAIEAGISSSPCALTDYKCICSSTGFINSIKAKIEQLCSVVDQQATLAFAKATCSSAGAELDDGDDTAAAAAPAASPAAAAEAPAESAASEAAPAASAAAGGEMAPDATSKVTVPTQTPLYPMANGTTGSMNGTNSTTTPFLGKAAGGKVAQLRGIVNAVAMGVVGSVVVGFL